MNRKNPKFECIGLFSTLWFQERELGFGVALGIGCTARWHILTHFCNPQSAQM